MLTCNAVDLCTLLVLCALLLIVSQLHDMERVHTCTRCMDWGNYLKDLLGLFTVHDVQSAVLLLC